MAPQSRNAKQSKKLDCIMFINTILEGESHAIVYYVIFVFTVMVSTSME